MNASDKLTDMLMIVADQPFLLFLLIIAATFVLEDIATIAVALLASHMVIDPPLAVVALTTGTILGDIAVFVIARRSTHIGFFARILSTGTFRTALGWLTSNAVPALLVARFTPGLRLPIFAAAGSGDVPFRLFVTVIALSTVIWTPGLFYLANVAGMTGVAKLGGLGWLLPASLVLLFVALSRAMPRLIDRGNAPVALVA